LSLVFDLALWAGIPLALFIGWAVRQPVGTRSVLYGAHCWFIHPWFVAAGWWKLWGFGLVTCPASGVTTSLRDWRLWLAFFVHDLGYWGCPNMDGEEGERHPAWGAHIVYLATRERQPPLVGKGLGLRWHDLTLWHSRYLAKQCGATPSRLCYADKLATWLEPAWLYIPRVIASREAREYMALAGRGKYAEGTHSAAIRSHLGSVRQWHAAMSRYQRDWALAHYSGEPDTWTPQQTKGVA
jgi:hypothetical protein